MSDMRSKHHSPILYGLGGLKGSGKDTVAELYLRLRTPGTVKIIGMSDPLEEAIWIMNPLLLLRNQTPYGESRDRLARYQDLYNARAQAGGNAYTEVKKIPEVRDWLQRFGTEVGREILGESTWVNVAKGKIKRAAETGHETIFVSGIRFPNELDMIREFGGTSVYVQREGNIVNRDSHASENSLNAEDFDVLIDNDGTLDDLNNTVKETLL